MTLTINRSDLEKVMGGDTTLEAMIKKGAAKIDGDASVLKKLGAAMVDFDPRFEIMPGTMLKPTDIDEANPYEAATGSPSVE